jgi:hypothetical protein
MFLDLRSGVPPSIRETQFSFLTSGKNSLYLQCLKGLFLSLFHEIAFLISS